VPTRVSLVSVLVVLVVVVLLSVVIVVVTFFFFELSQIPPKLVVLFKCLSPFAVFGEEDFSVVLAGEGEGGWRWEECGNRFFRWKKK